MTESVLLLDKHRFLARNYILSPNVPTNTGFLFIKLSFVATKLSFDVMKLGFVTTNIGLLHKTDVLSTK